MARPFEHIADTFRDAHREAERQALAMLKEAGLSEGTLVAWPSFHGSYEVWQVTHLRFVRGQITAYGNKQLKRAPSGRRAGKRLPFSVNTMPIGLVRDLHLVGDVQAFTPNTEKSA